MSYNLHTVKFTLFERVSYRYNSLLFSIFTKFWNYHHYLISDHIHHLQSNSTSISSNFQFSLPIFPSSQLLGTTNLFPVSVDLPILGSLYKWNHRIGDHLCLAFLTQYNVLTIHPCCSMCQCFIPMVKYYSIVWIYHNCLSTHLCIDIHHFYIPFGENPTEILCPFQNWVIYLFSC